MKNFNAIPHNPPKT